MEASQPAYRAGALCRDLTSSLIPIQNLISVHMSRVSLDPNTSANGMNHDLELISQWARDCKMSFNPDPQKQAVELTFSRKKIEIDHPNIFFNNIPVKKVDEHKHLGIVLDTKLSFSAHIKEAISKKRKGIGMLKYLSSYLPRHTLNEPYKLYVRPHLDHGDVIYHVPAKMCALSLNVTLSSTEPFLTDFKWGGKS